MLKKVTQTNNKEDSTLLSNSSHQHWCVDNKKIHSQIVKYDDECNCNHCNTLHLFVWWNQSLIEKKDNYAVLKSHPNCYVTSEGVYNIDTCELAPSYIALQKYASLNKLEAHYVCTEFMKQANADNIKSMLIYTAKNYGYGNMPQVASDALNYILDDDIIGTEQTAYATLFGILADNFHISKDVIFEMVNRKYIIVDSKYNICFLSYDENGNVSSVLKMSRYNHSDTIFSYNRYVTKQNVGFTYCSEEAKQNNTFDSVTVFDSPIELLSYLTLESNQIVASLGEGGCYLSMYNSNPLSVKEWLNKHDEVSTLNIATRFNAVNGYIKKFFYNIAEALNVPNVQELNKLIDAYRDRAIMKNYCVSFRLDGWNTLIKFCLGMLAAKFNSIPRYEIKRYERKSVIVQ